MLRKGATKKDSSNYTNNYSNSYPNNYSNNYPNQLNKVQIKIQEIMQPQLHNMRKRKKLNDIEKIITDEKYNLELKEQVNFDKPKKYLKAVSAFANGQDIGYLIFGIEDGTKKIVGVKNLMKKLQIE